jgi:hypothetical protein
MEDKLVFGFAVLVVFCFLSCSQDKRSGSTPNTEKSSEKTVGATGLSGKYRPSGFFPLTNNEKSVVFKENNEVLITWNSHQFAGTYSLKGSDLTLTVNSGTVVWEATLSEDKRSFVVNNPAHGTYIKE